MCFAREELQSVQRELEVLSEQYSQKCLENAHLAQALEAERQALRQCQRENQELNAHNQVRVRAVPRAAAWAGSDRQTGRWAAWWALRRAMAALPLPITALLLFPGAE